MQFDIVIVTRNRPDALELSIPLMLAQSRQPQQLIVVDSSDDHPRVRKTVERLMSGSPVQLKILHSEPGTTRQRNEGLAQVEAPVVMYPDDDALWFPGVAEAILRVYERDVEELIGGVCAAESPTPPPGVFESSAATYAMRPSDRFKQRIAHRRAATERKLFPDPFVLHGRSRWSVRPVPPWLLEEDAVQVEWMTGFRMTFRTHLIREHGFDEVFRYYGGFEDVDASFKIMQTHLVVGARRAKVYHYRAPQQRSSGLGMGMRQVLNRAYIVCSYSPADSPARHRLSRYGYYKILQYLLGVHSPYGRERVAGAWRAVRRIPQLLNATPEELPAIYQRLRGECLETRKRD